MAKEHRMVDWKSPRTCKEMSPNMKDIFVNLPSLPIVTTRSLLVSGIQCDCCNKDESFKHVEFVLMYIDDELLLRPDMTFDATVTSDFDDGGSRKNL
jgi:hypothetical protein